MNQLTTRETEILNLVISGFNNQQVAAKLNISLNETNGYISNIYIKLVNKIRANGPNYNPEIALL